MIDNIKMITFYRFLYRIKTNLAKNTNIINDNPIQIIKPLTKTNTNFNINFNYKMNELRENKMNNIKFQKIIKYLDNKEPIDKEMIGIINGCLVVFGLGYLFWRF